MNALTLRRASGKRRANHSGVASIQSEGKLRDDVLVAIRVITSSGDKGFASNVAVNQNNQNQMGTGFLRSNDPRIVQLDSALASRGWHLERREGDAECTNG